MKAIISGTVLCALLLGATTPAQKPKAREATFDVRQEIKINIPEGAKKVRLWVAAPQDDPAQTVTDFKVTAPVPHRIERDRTEGNKIIYLEVSQPTAREITVVETFRVTRREARGQIAPQAASPITEAERRKYARELQANQHVQIDDRIRKIAQDVAGGEKNPVVVGRKVYDWVLNNVEYWVKDPSRWKASSVGSTEYCLTSKTGNCTDFHSLYASITRAAGIPTRIIYGSLFKTELDGKDADQSYHCWVEIYGGKAGWVPLDVAVADIYAGDIKLTPENTSLVRLTTADGYTGKDMKKADYYFGHLDERRVT